MNDELRTQPRQARSAVTVEHILDTAERLFHQRGVTETSTVDIAAAAGISVGRLYYWFPDKDAVVRGVMSRAERLAADFLVAEVVDDPSQQTSSLLKQIIAALGHFVTVHPGALAVLRHHPRREDDPGGTMFRLFVELAASIVSERVPDVPDAERDLVAITCVRIALAMLDEHLRHGIDTESPNHMIEELHYVIVAYVNARYPLLDDPRWQDPMHPVQPSRPARPYDGPSTVVYPALGGRQPVGTGAAANDGR
jgi:AcrR family transcriptional regulator